MSSIDPSQANNTKLTNDGKIYYKGRKRYENGDLYEGEIIDGVREGKGKLLCINGDRYVGNFKDDVFEGHGTYFWNISYFNHLNEASSNSPSSTNKINSSANSSSNTNRTRYYEGYWKRNKPHGKGLYKKEDGEIYIGNFYNGLYHGEGRLTTKSGDIIEGTFYRGATHGKIHIIFKKKKHYESIENNDDNDEDLIIHGHETDEEIQRKKREKRRRIREREIQRENKKKHEKDKILYDLFKQTLNNHIGGIGLSQLVETSTNMSVGLHGGEYEGEMKEGIYEGTGKIVYGDSLGSYEGEWKRGQACGQGIRIYCDQTKYIGQFLDGVPHGEGMILYANGDQYIGNFSMGYVHGHGLYNFTDGRSYKGEFVLGYFHGQGLLKYPDGSFYDGEFLNKKLNLNKLLKLSNIKASTNLEKKKLFLLRNNKQFNSKDYEIPIYDSLKHGIGIRKWSSGSLYEGSWKEDKMDGPGKLIKSEGGLYDGEFWKNMRHGNGIELFGNELGIEFVCPFGIKHHGIGYCQYQGNYYHDLFHGYGEFKCLSGKYYKGQWNHGKKYGKGEICLISALEHGNRDRLYIGGADALYRFNYYYGDFNDNKRSGFGTGVYSNGNKIQGRFKDGFPTGLCKYMYVKINKIKKEDELKLENEESNKSNNPKIDNQSFPTKSSKRSIFNQNKNKSPPVQPTNTSTNTTSYITHEFKYGLYDNGYRIKWLENNDDELDILLNNDSDLVNFFQTEIEKNFKENTKEEII